MNGPLYKTLGNGNCAFNALALALADAIVAGHFDGSALHQQQQRAKILCLLKENITWEQFKKNLLKQNANDLQLYAAPLLRDLIVTLITLQQEDYIERTQHSLSAAFNDYRYPKIPENNRDDIYTVHKFIAEKFHQLVSLPDFEAEKQLSEWWKKEGFKKFLTKIKKDGVFVGDLELALLAQYFGINIVFLRNNYPMGDSSHAVHGNIPKTKLTLTPQQEAYLREQGVFKEILPSEIVTEGNTKNYLLLKCPDQKLRDILNNGSASAINFSDSEKNTVFEVWKQHYITSVPTIYLCNENSHWDYQAEHLSAWPTLAKQINKEMYVQENYIKKLTDTYKPNFSANVTFFGKSIQHLTDTILNTAVKAESETESAFLNRLQEAEVALYFYKQRA